MEIVVFGAGSLGSLVGGLLAREHEITLVGRDPHISAVRESGLRVVDATDVDATTEEDDPAAEEDGGAFDFEVHPDATTDGTDLSADLAVVTVKAFDTQLAAETLATGRIEAALSLQNGMGNEETLAQSLDCPVLAGTITYGAVLREPGVVACTGEGELVLGPREGGTSDPANRVGEAFHTAGFDATVADDMPRRLWEKLAVNAGINATTALARVENGAVLSGPAHEVATEAARETARVARAEGVELSDSEAVQAVERVAEATAANISSMYQDVLAERRTEVEAINEYVVANAREQDLSVPVNRTLTDLLRAWERERPQD